MNVSLLQIFGSKGQLIAEAPLKVYDAEALRKVYGTLPYDDAVRVPPPIRHAFLAVGEAEGNFTAYAIGQKAVT